MRRRTKAYRGWRFSCSLLLLSALSLVFGCDGQGGGDAPCPEGTIRSGEECLPSEGGAGFETGGGGVIAGLSGGASGATEAGVTAGDEGGAQGGEGGREAPLSYPMPLDDHFAPSGFMGEGEVGNISADLECPERATGALGLCHHFTYTAGDIGWGGVWWQHPEGNWGDGPGLSMPSGLTSVSFKAWGVSGAEELSFGVGYGAVDGFSVKLSSVTLETSPQRYVIDLAGVPVEQLAGGFYWATEGDSAIEFYLDDLRFNDDPAEVNPCTVACAVAGAQEGCAGPDYVACAERCEAEVSGDCGAEALTLWTCLSEEGWRCGEEQRVGASTCDNAQDAFEECSGPAPVVSLPFSVSEHFIMSGYMGGGEVTLGECPEGRSSGCVKLTWAPNGAEWVGFYFQYPENNWGDLPGLEIESGATHVRYTAWGETGSERANFATGIADADGFNVESGYATLPDSPTQGFLELPEGITEVTGAFAWFLENPTGADEVVFYLDQVEWRGDELPGVEPGDIPGCTDAGADNYQEGATMNDGSCVYSVTFNVDMSCEEAPEDFNTVYITGPFCSWCDAGFPLSDEDGDGVWSGTYAFPAGPLEYKYMVDGFASQEDLIDDVQSNDGACAPVTDGSSYANRQTQVTAGGSTSDSYGRCAACDVAPPEPPMIGDFETVTFDNPEVTYSLLGFGGADDSTITTNEQFSEGRVARVLKSATAELWAGTTVVTGPNSSVGRLPIDAENTRLTVKVWSPHAGIPVRVKLEDASDPTVTVEAEATVSVADAEEVLTFDFAQQVSGTAALNPEATYNKLSIFFNFGQPGAEAGERVYYFDDITFIGGTSEPTGPTEASVTFEVDMTCPEAPESFGTVYVTGPFCNWCAEGFPLSDPDGDGVWSGTYTFPVGPLEYKLMVDGFASQEDLIDDVQAGDGACAPVTDGASYANRQAQLSEDVTLSMIYGRCSACEEEPPPGPVGFETVTFDNPEVTYSLLGFGGADDSTITTNPQFGEGSVARVLKSASAELWAGTTVVTGPNSSVGRLPIDAENTRLTVKVWSPHAGIPVRVKLEDASDPTVTVEAEATVSVADAEEVLTFDFAQQVSGTAVLNPEATYNKLSIFFNFGQPGAEAGERVYYFDDITFIGGTSEPTGPTEASVTFEVDMTCPEAPESFGTVYVTGPFCNWCAEGFPLSDPDGDDVWSGTYTFPVGPLEYKLMVDGFASQEDLIDDVQAGDGACAPVTDGSNYANRQAQLSEDVTLSMVYGRCSACPGDGLAVDGLLTEQDGWRLTWSDEFNGPERSPVDPAKWTHDIGGSGWGNAQLEYNTDRVENVSHTGDGYLAITARREEFMGNGYTSARIKTQGLFSQQYGRFEARIQLPFGQGMWPAFWMLGDDIDQVSWPNCGEIDIMEYRGQEPQVSTGALHGPGYSGGASLYGTFSNGQSRATQFHIYAVEWSPESIKWFVDDELFMERSPGDVPSGSPWAFDHSFFMILNLAVGGNYVGSPDASTRFPQEMRVDYVRVYEQVTP